MTVVISPRAVGDLEAIAHYSLMRFGFAQALKYQTDLRRTFDLLAEFPHMSPVRDDIMAGSVRLRHHKAHVIVYQEVPDGILVVRVLDARRDWTRLLD
jgi:toxin ParE1/3/4